MAGAATDPQIERKANELYWASDRSVNQIAEELGLSKGVLYGLIRPWPAAFVCPVCSADLVYTNRTALDRGLVECPACGWEGDEDEADPAETRSSDMAEGDEPDVTEGVGRLREALETTWGRTALGGALLGAAAGLAFVIWNRRYR